MTSINTRDNNPGAFGLRDSTAAIRIAATVFSNKIETKMIHCEFKIIPPVFGAKTTGFPVV